MPLLLTAAVLLPAVGATIGYYLSISSPGSRVEPQRIPSGGLVDYSPDDGVGLGPPNVAVVPDGSRGVNVHITLIGGVFQYLLPELRSRSLRNRPRPRPQEGLDVVARGLAAPSGRHAPIHPMPAVRRPKSENPERTSGSPYQVISRRGAGTPRWPRSRQASKQTTSFGKGRFGSSGPCHPEAELPRGLLAS